MSLNKEQANYITVYKIPRKCKIKMEKQKRRNLDNKITLHTRYQSYYLSCIQYRVAQVHRRVRILGVEVFQHIQSTKLCRRKTVMLLLEHTTSLVLTDFWFSHSKVQNRCDAGWTNKPGPLSGVGRKCHIAFLFHCVLVLNFHNFLELS